MSNLLFKDTVYINIVLKKLDEVWKMSFLNFISNSLKEFDCLIHFGKLFYSTALLKVELHLQ